MNVLMRRGLLASRGNAFKLFSASYSVQATGKERIASLVKDKKLVVFMKGNPTVPQCGFSKAVVQILEVHGIKDYDTHNVLENEDLRQGVKEYSNWPTIPQVYMGGEFIGGCDILLEMHQNGDLIDELKKIGITSSLLDPAAKKP